LRPYGKFTRTRRCGRGRSSPQGFWRGSRPGRLHASGEPGLEPRAGARRQFGRRTLANRQFRQIRPNRFFFSRPRPASGALAVGPGDEQAVFLELLVQPDPADAEFPRRPRPLVVVLVQDLLDPPDLGLRLALVQGARPGPLALAGGRDGAADLRRG